MRLLSNLFALAAVITALVTCWVIWPPLVGILGAFLFGRLAMLTDGAASPPLKESE
jgi:hypothetical protein